jgi:hypothetical protein
VCAGLESGTGQRLLRVGDLHVGSGVGCMVRLGMPAGGAGVRMRPARQMVLVGTLDGGLSVVMPVQEKRFQRLILLQHRMNTFLPHRAGLNPRAFRYGPHTHTHTHTHTCTHKHTYTYTYREAHLHSEVRPWSPKASSCGGCGRAASARVCVRLRERRD